jgi:serine-type D-Ala-D-Ala carboxypeptidase (penicillin-binding protein 5/6)
MSELLKKRVCVGLLLFLVAALLVSASYLGFGAPSVGAQPTDISLLAANAGPQATTTTKRPATTTTVKRAGGTATTKRPASTGTTRPATTTTTVPGPPGFAPLHAPAAIVIDMKTGKMLYGRSPDQKRAMASTTKIMTSILAIERLPLDKIVTISQHSAATGEQSLQLKAGERLTVEQLLFGTMVWSANDGAVALAEAVSGTETAFVKEMNEKAVELGLTNTHYANAHGLDAPGHYTSARDLALLARYAMQDPEFRKLAGTVYYNLQVPGRPKAFNCRNVNKLVGFVREATGVKTGFTDDAKFCLVASVNSGGRELMSVVLGDPSWSEVYADTLVLLLYGLSCPST